MSVSIASTIWSCAHPKVNGEQAGRAQSARFLDPSLSVVTNLFRDANDAPYGRPMNFNSQNGNDGIPSGFQGLNPTGLVALETVQRQVAFQSTLPNTTFYDTISGANRSAFPSQKAGKSGALCSLYNGPTAYTLTPYQSNSNGQLTSVDRANYMNALHQVYSGNN